MGDPTVLKGPPETDEAESLINEEFENIEEEELEDLFNKNTESFRCLAQILISRSSLLRHPLYHFPPLPDPGLDAAINYVEPETVIDNVGLEYYLKLCKDFGIVPISRVIRSLPTEIIDLKYYGLTDKSVRAIMGALTKNEFVRVVILEDNWLSPDACKRISDMLLVNTTLQSLIMKECRIKPEGAKALVSGITHTQTLLELDLSFNSLGDEGLIILEDALGFNTSLKKLNLSRNDLGEDSALTLSRIFDQNDRFADLDLSWNEFYTGVGNKPLFKSIEDSPHLKVLNLAWNSIGVKEAAGPVGRFLRTADLLEHFDISNNRLTQESFQSVRNGLSKCTKLISLKIGNNPLTPDEGFSAARLLNTLTFLKYVDLDNVFLNKDFVPFWKRQTRRGISIIIGGILCNYTIKGPDLTKLAFDRANFLAKKSKKNFGHFILQMPESNLTKQEFEKLVKKFKMKKIDKDLVTFISSQYPAKKKKINLVEMRETYMSYFPDTVLPAPKKGKEEKPKPQKGKEEPVTTEGQVEAAPPAEGQAPTLEDQPPADGTSPPTEEGQIEGAPASPEGEPPPEGEAQAAESAKPEEQPEAASNQQETADNQQPPEVQVAA